MAELGGMLAAAILKVVGHQIGSAIGGQITLQKNFNSDLRKMKMTLESVEAVLKAAERRSITDEPIRLWLKRLTDAMYDISSIIDEFEEDTQATTQPSARKLFFKKYLAIMIPCLTIGPKIETANRMEKMREDLEEITNQHKKFKSTDGTGSSEPRVTDIRETTSIMETQIIGRTTERDEILASLSQSMHKDITILPIYGIGGLGKTTLAKMVYNSSQFKEYSQVWVYVSQTFDLINIGNSIISQLSNEKKESQYTRMQMIHNSLQDLFADKKILIVLDDLWEGKVGHLEGLMNMLKIGKDSNVVVIVTTRDEEIAQKISTIQPLKLAPLTDEVCWSIIKQKSAFESRGGKLQLEEIGKAIAMKCCGVALAANSLGHMLQSVDFGEWESVRDSNIWNVSSLEDTSSTQVLASLMLSYSVMPSYLKICFAYCAIFPRGHKIAKDDLINQWVSLGFCTWQDGERCIRQLLGLSFLEYSKSQSTVAMYQDMTMLSMHDLVLDLARSVMNDEILVISKGGNIDGRCYHYALLDDCSKSLGLESSKIRALRFVNCDKIKLHDAALSSAKSLRVLDLSECSIHKLPDSIGVLKQLRYLNAPRVQDAVIPNSITRLSKLIYLNLHGSSRILALPESIGEIEGLVYLDLSGCSRIEKLPESFGGLKELVHLDLSNCSCVGDISPFLGSLTQLQYLDLSFCKSIGKLPEAMGLLCKLQYLNLSFSSYIDCCTEAEVLGALTKLKYLNLSSKYCCLLKLPEDLGTFTQLKYLNLSGCSDLTKLPRLFGSLTNLVHLDLSLCSGISPIDAALFGHASLEYLNVRGTNLTSLPSDLTKLRYLNLSKPSWMTEDIFHSLINHISSNFSHLEHLNLSENICIHSIPESLCNLRKLQTLDLSKCTSLKKIPKGLGTIDSLKFLDLNGCDRIEELPQLGSGSVSSPHFVVQPVNGQSSSNLVLLQHTNPIKLQITELENVKSAGEAHCIKLMEKQRLQDLKLEWTGDVKRFVDDKTLLEKLVPPSTLKELEISGYNGVSFPSWLVGQLPNLEKLVLRGMASLKEWNTSYSSGEEHVFQTLEIHDCPMLRMKPLPPKAKSWMISSSDNVLTSLEECTMSQTTSSSSLVTTELSVQDCKVPLHRWTLLQHFSGLTCLSIHNCAGLTGSPDIIQQLSSVEKPCQEDWDLGEHDLKIAGYKVLKGLNENMRHLTKLQSLKLDGCNGMTSLPHWFCGLTSLKKLYIWYCPKLKHLFEPEEGNMKLTHNQDKLCVLPTSLKRLDIRNCMGIKSLPESIQQLADLIIGSCPELKAWSELEENKMKLDQIKCKIIYY